MEIVSTGSTAETIAGAGLPVTGIEQVTGFPECLDGRVKTLHPKVHAGLLADMRLESHRAQLAELGVEPFDLLISNLYPFTATVASGASPEACIEQIDIGGPAMVRSSAKNHASVAVITSPEQYPQLLQAIAAGGFTLAGAASGLRRWPSSTRPPTTLRWRAGWEASSADLSEGTGFPKWMGGTWEKVTGLRYGENPHQPAALYRTSGVTRGLASAQQLHGKEMSYNNYVDADAARRSAGDFDEPAVAIIKHANPCGIAVGSDIAEAHRKAHACDPISAYGGVIAANRPVSVEMARQVAEIFTEVIIAPGYADGALEVLAAKKNLRILLVEPPARGGVESSRIDGGLLVQLSDRVDADHDYAPSIGSWSQVSRPPAETLADLEFAWKAVRSVKSNAILLARDGASVGVGMGQVNRVDSCRLAVQRAGERAAGSVAASDAFFPFAGRTRDPARMPGCQPSFSPAARSGTRTSLRPCRLPERRCISLARDTSSTDSDRGEVLHMTAQILDGRALAETIKAELRDRVSVLAERGIVPGLGTVLVGDDPGSRSYVAGKHRDCAQVGIASIQVELPDSTSQEQLASVIAELNADPACTGYIVQLPLPGDLDDNAALALVDPDKDADGLHPVNLGRLVLGVPGPLPCTPRGIVELLRRNGIEPQRRRGLRDRPRYHGWPAARTAADSQERKRDSHPVSYRHR